VPPQVINSAALQSETDQSSLKGNSSRDVAVYGIFEESVVCFRSHIFDSENGDSTFFRNIGKLLRDFIESHSQNTTELLYILTTMITSNLTTFSEHRHNNTKSLEPVIKPATNVMLETIFNKLITKIRHRHFRSFAV
jgi:hypothetical protein